MIKQSASRLLDELDIKNNSSANAKWLSNVVEKMSRFRSIYQNYPPSAISRNVILNSKKKKLDKMIVTANVTISVSVLCKTIFHWA